MHYNAPWWLPGGHLQTIWSATLARSSDATPRWRRERWDAPDGDFVDVDHLVHAPLAVDAADARRPLLVLFHGLEGSSASHYALAFAEQAQARGWDFAVPHFRGCSGEINRAPRAYHSGDFEEVHWLLERFASSAPTSLYAVGVSLGGNALMRWAGELGGRATQIANAVASICAPLDLVAGGKAIDHGFNRQVYARMFLRTMIPKARAKLAQYPGLLDAERLRNVRELHAFDDVFTAPLHGFRDADDYWRRASAKPLLGQVQVPALVVNALNDPFVPACSLPVPSEVSSQVQLWQPATGGHVGFAAGRWPGHVRCLPEQVVAWLAAC